MRKEIKLGAILGYANLIITTLVTLIYTPFMLKHMGQSEYGLYSLVASIVAYLSVLDMGFGNAMIRFVSRSQAKKDNKEAKINGMFLFLYSIIGILALIVGFVLYANVETIFSTSLTPSELAKTRILMIIMITNVVVSFPLSVFDSYVITNEKYIYAKSLTILKNLFKPLFMIPLLLLGYKSIAMAIITVTANILFHISMLIYSFKKLKMKITFKFKDFDKKMLVEIGGYSFFIFLNIVVDSLFNNTDQVILGAVSGTIAVSIYAIASQISQINTQFSTVISSLFLPKITKLLEEKEADKKISDLFNKVSRIQLYIMMLILSGFIIFGKTFITLWAGKDYLDAYYIVLLLIGPSIIPLTQNLAISVIQARNQHQFRSVVYIIIAVLNVVISIPLARRYAGIGAAIGTALSTILGQIITMNIFYKVKAKLDIKSYWKHFIKFFIQISCIAIPFYLIINQLNLNIIKLILFALLYCIIYAIISYLNMNQEEKIIIKKITNKLYNLILFKKNEKKN